MTRRRAAFAFLPLAATLSAGADVRPVPGAIRTFGDWSVACDNTKRCTMASLGPEAGDFPRATLRVQRDAGPAGGYTIAWQVEDAGSPAAMAVDGRRMPLAGTTLGGTRAATLAGAIANARALRLLRGNGTPLGSVSLTGAAAALRYIDAAQGRAGTVTATVARGAAPATRVPAAPALPVVVALRPGGRAAAVPAAMLRAMRTTARCDAPPSRDVVWTPETAALGGGTTLVVLPCSTGAYNLIGALFVIRGGRAQPAAVDAPAGFEATGADPGTPVHSVINGAFANGLLESYAKGRGLGDCGLAQSFAWDGTRLRLVAQGEMRECRGNRDLLPTWRARVVRR